MLRIIARPGLRYVLLANVISMFGSGMNIAAVTWFLLQATHSEVYLAYLVILQTIPSLLLGPFSGVIIDREDRRHLLMVLDSGRGAVILVVALLALTHHVQLWHLYAMGMVVSVGHWMFWPTVNALMQELTPAEDFVHANTFLMAGVQGGWMIAGAVVGFMYDHIGLGGILLIDVMTYVASMLCYFAVRKGKQVVQKPTDPLRELEQAAMSAFQRYMHDLAEGLQFVRTRPKVLQLGISWMLFLGALMTTSIITAPLSEHILHGGAKAYGWLNGAWGTGALLAALGTASFIARVGAHRAVKYCFAVLAFGMYLVPFSRMVWIAMTMFLFMGASRSLCGIAISSDMMHAVPKHMMGRVQNIFYFAGMVLQVLLSAVIGWVAHDWSLTAAFCIIASVFLIAMLLTLGHEPAPEAEPSEAGSA